MVWYWPSPVSYPFKMFVVSIFPLLSLLLSQGSINIELSGFCPLFCVSHLLFHIMCLSHITMCSKWPLMAPHQVQVFLSFWALHTLELSYLFMLHPPLDELCLLGSWQSLIAFSSKPCSRGSLAGLAVSCHYLFDLHLSSTVKLRYHQLHKSVSGSLSAAIDHFPLRSLSHVV